MCYLEDKLLKHKGGREREGDEGRKRYEEEKRGGRDTKRRGGRDRGEGEGRRERRGTPIEGEERRERREGGKRRMGFITEHYIALYERFACSVHR